jgi:hypothetical protein
VKFAKKKIPVLSGELFAKFALRQAAIPSVVGLDQFNFT